MRPSKIAALCGISTALGCALLLLARLELPVTLALYAGSSIAIMIPLSRSLYKGAALTAAATALIVFLLGGAVTVTVPYAFFFGIHPILSALAVRHIGRDIKAVIISTALKLAVFIGLYYLAISIADFAALLPKGIDYNVFMLILAAVFIPYDYFMGFVQCSVTLFVNRYLKL